MPQNEPKVAEYAGGMLLKRMLRAYQEEFNLRPS